MKGLGAALGVIANVFMMHTKMGVADYTPQQRVIDAISEMIGKGYTDRPRDAFIESIEEANQVEIESWRLSKAEFNDAIGIIKGLPYPKDMKDEFIASLTEERDRMTDCEDD